MNVREGLRLSLGTLTVLPVGTVRVDRRTAGSAMLWAPVVGAGLGAAAGSAAWTAAWFGAPPLVAAGAALVLLAVATRGLHLDGLADTADGLGSGHEPARALEVMKDSRTGAFGVITLVLTLLLQAAAWAAWLGYGNNDGRVIAVGALAGTASRGTLPWACRAGMPAARGDGLGATVAGSVDPLVALGATAVVIAAQTLIGGLSDVGVFRSLVAALLAWAGAEALLQRARRRFGGVTGDVLGACVEIATTIALVTLSTS
jgi:adenosylcobinamide-GDP ribazoletransferase